MNKVAIIILSVLVPSLVAMLFFTVKIESTSTWVHTLPLVNASINGISAIVLIAAVWFIKNGNEVMHKRFMLTAFILGVLFMVSYITYHSSVPSTKLGDLNGDGLLQEMESNEIGAMRGVYLGLLLSHILMAVAALPLILSAFAYGLKDKREMHKKIVRFTFPVWLYVSITGVIVYLLISPYY